jgi:superfamily I DNA/RNA helicase
MDFLEGLNSQQKQAVEAEDGPLLIVAGPGTGKTKTLTARISHLLETGKAQPQEILTLTFTKKAAEELQKRLLNHNISDLELGPQKVNVATFHGVCFDILGLNEKTQQFATNVQRLQVIKGLNKTKGFKGVSARELGLLISRAKNTVDPDENIAKMVDAYNQVLAEQGLLDFDDLLQNTYQLLKTNAQKRGEVAARYKYILVDEFQDTNRLQYEILRQLLQNHQNVFVIGDPQQSIYGFRGAHGGIFDQFKTDFPGHKQIALTINYRSVPQVVNLSNAIFREDINLEPASKETGTVRAVEVLNEFSEAAWVLKEIQQAIGGGDLQLAVSDDKREDHYKLNDFAVLYRSRRAAAVLKTVLEESGLPYQVVGDGSPYDQPEVQAVIALMRAALQGEVPEVEGFTKAERHQLAETLAGYEQIPPADFAEHCIEILGLDLDRNLQQLLSVLVKHKTLSQALEYFERIAEQGFYDPSADAISLLTIHAAKGLEFPQVFLIGAEEGILPGGRTSDKDEERRLFYVAVTRAKNRLDILHTQKRGAQNSKVSSFVADLPTSVLKRLIDPDIQDQIRRIAKRVAKRSQQSLF